MNTPHCWDEHYRPGSSLLWTNKESIDEEKTFGWVGGNVVFKNENKVKVKEDTTLTGLKLLEVPFYNLAEKKKVNKVNK